VGWASAGQIFDPVARSLIELGAPDDMKRRVLGDLIGALQDGDWDTEDESLDEFKDDQAIVAAFKDHAVYIRCQQTDSADERECMLPVGHQGGHAEYDGGPTWDAEPDYDPYEDDMRAERDYGIPADDDPDAF
jgi:hypothetical protein